MSIERIKENVIKVLKRRGYTDIEEDKDNSEEDYIGFVITFKISEKQKGKCLYCIEKMGIEQMSQIFGKMLDEKNYLILLYSSITNFVSKSYKDNISKFLKTAELIDSTLFFQDILSHPLIPYYRALTDEETETVLKQYTIKGTKIEDTKEAFPKLLTTDPVSILMGFKEGQVVKVLDYYNFTRKITDYKMPPTITYCIVEGVNE